VLREVERTLERLKRLKRLSLPAEGWGVEVIKYNKMIRQWLENDQIKKGPKVIFRTLDMI
jgi:hypothetical protein